MYRLSAGLKCEIPGSGVFNHSNHCGFEPRTVAHPADNVDVNVGCTEYQHYSADIQRAQYRGTVCLTGELCVCTKP